MICPKCGSKMAVINSITASRSGRVQRLVCRKCEFVGVAITVLAVEEPGYGQSTLSVARKLAAGQIKVEVSEISNRQIQKKLDHDPLDGQEPIPASPSGLKTPGSAAQGMIQRSVPSISRGNSTTGQR